MIEKNKQTAGADEKTPSRAQYFSWINHTNEGSDEGQTLANLDYFRWLKETYGMQLDIYAWDAGNLDGARQTYERMDSPKLRAQYPNGYAPIAAAAEKIGARLGVWCGPDGFGNTDEEAAARHELMVSLCRDYHFALFKIDGVCGTLRPEKRPNFSAMMAECRKYSPDLILLNHRLELGEGEKYATTFLWQGAETYVDVHSSNSGTAPHHRAFIFGRGTVEGLRRLTEDHGVCISSCVDYFEDDLIYQAFNRNLILAPEIYGNPWLMRDEEQAHLAHLYNLHRVWNDILVEGMLLPAEIYGENAVARGDSARRILTFGNPSWEAKEFTLRLNGEIGLGKCDRVKVISHHPYTRVVGEFAYGEEVSLTVEAFRAALVEVCDARVSPDLPENCEFLVLHEDAACRPDRIKIIAAHHPAIRRLAAAQACPLPAYADRMAEQALFTMDNDSLERRSLRRSGPTAIPEIKAARDAFFGQDTYRLKGCDSDYAFDGRSDTFFDGVSRQAAWGGLRIDGGCLRIDFGEQYDADGVEFEFLEAITPTAEALAQIIPTAVETSVDLAHWTAVSGGELSVLGEEPLDVVRNAVNDIYTIPARRCVLRFALTESLRYLRMPSPLDRICRISLTKAGVRLPLNQPKASNLLPVRPVIGTKKAVLRVDSADWRPDSYLAVAMEGVHGVEGAYVCLEAEGRLIGSPDRAPSYLSNVWEYRVARTDRNTTCYLPLPAELVGKELTVWVLMLDGEHTDFTAELYLCPPNSEPEGKIITR